MSVLRLIPNVRQTAALLAPLSSAVITAASIATGRPPRWQYQPRPVIGHNRLVSLDDHATLFQLCPLMRTSSAFRYFRPRNRAIDVFDL